jgi:shikimate dehydrogenase
MVEPLSFALLGAPVSHSLSARMFRAAFSYLGLPHRYELVEVADRAALERELSALRSGSRAGANVTMPHKREALELADEAAPSARGTGAANVLVRIASGAVVAHNTDVGALAGRVAPRLSAGRLRAALVLGAGGGALAAVAALRSLGAGRVLVTNRSFVDGVGRDLRADSLERAGATIVPWARPDAATADELDVVVQATSCGVSGGAPQTRELLALVPWPALPRDAFAIDLVYGPFETPFVERAQLEGLAAESGLEMLVAQAEASFEAWLGRHSPAGVMRAAAEDALAQRRRP